MTDELRIGRKIRQIRKQSRLTLEEVARKTGFTKSYLSMVESGKKSPPIATLSKIAQALSVDMAVFFEKRNPEEHLTLVRRKDRETVVRDGTLFGYRYEAIAPAKRPKKMEPFIITLPLRSKEGDRFDHEGEELFFVLKGRVRFYYGEKEYLLEEGDCVYFDSSIPHRGEGIGKRPAKALIVLYTP